MMLISKQFYPAPNYYHICLASSKICLKKKKNFPLSCFAWKAFIGVYDSWKFAKYHVWGKGRTQQHGAVKCFPNATMPSSDMLK